MLVVQCVVFVLCVVLMVEQCAESGVVLLMQCEVFVVLLVVQHAVCVVLVVVQCAESGVVLLMHGAESAMELAV